MKKLSNDPLESSSVFMSITNNSYKNGNDLLRNITTQVLIKGIVLLG